MQRPHLYFRNPPENSARFTPHTRFPQREEEDDTPKNYTPMKEDFISSLSNFRSLKQQRDSRRNPRLAIPATVDYLVFEFFDYFDSSSFENHYRTHFGLVPILYEKFNTIGYFAIADESLFSHFIRDLQTFIESENPATSTDYDSHIRYIKRFTFHTSDGMRRYTEPRRLVFLDLFDSIDLFTSRIQPIVDSLDRYLNEKGFSYSIDQPLGRVEIVNPGEGAIQEIMDNFDVIHSVRSPLAGVVRPSAFNLPMREYGFEIADSTADLPIIGIIDTGISDRTPLAPLIINSNNDFDLTSTGVKVDNADHGTAVAALAALGATPYPSYRGRFKADARLLSIKVLDDTHGMVSETSVLQMIRKANREIGVRLFVLSIGYQDHLPDNSNVSNYARSLDALANELDVLILIPSGNVHEMVQYMFQSPTSDRNTPYPKHYRSPDFNLCSPADSFNNVTCGAISDNLELTTSENYYSSEKSFPASYTRKLNLNRDEITRGRVSTHLLKPDCSHPGGDYSSRTEYATTGLKVLSAGEGQFFERSVGTSYATPLLANLAAKLLQAYPALSANMQTVKALILNSAAMPSTSDWFSGLTNKMRVEDFIGRGSADDVKAVYSDDNAITLVLESTINPEEIRSYPIHLPNYLLGLSHRKGIVEVNATLCFKFAPISENHLAYCPIHMAFGIFKNVPLVLNSIDENDRVVHSGINGGKKEQYVFNESWSEDYYYRAKLLSNAQKIRFNISKAHLVNEHNEFRIAVRSRFHRLLNGIQKDRYNAPHAFSLVISMRERPISGSVSNRLYDEMMLINEVRAIAELGAELEV